MPNPMMPQGAELPPEQQMPQAQDGPTGGPPAPVDSLAHIEASYNKLRSAQGLLSKVRSGLDSLVTLADTVTPEDVIKVAGKLVGEGLTAGGMASLLADMPENPEQLMQWVAQHDKDVTNREQQLNQMTDQFRHQLGVEGLKKIMSNAGQQAPAAAQPQEAQSAPTIAPQSMGM